MSWWTRHRKDLNPYHAVNDFVNGVNYEAKHVFGLEADPTGEKGGGTGVDFHVQTTTPTDMGFDLESKNTALTMGEMAPGEYTEMYGNNTAYNENKENEKSTWDYVAEYGIPAATALAQTYLTNRYNKQLQREQNNWNAEQAELNRQFNATESEKARQYETNMANTAHQREMADLLATGLNPVNTATGGGGAATPGGSAASGTPATGTNPAYMDHTALANTALSMAETAKAIKEMPYIAKEKKAQIANAEADTLLKGAETTKTGAETRKIQAEEENLEETKKLIQENVRQAKKNNDFNDIIKVSDNTPQGYRYMRTMLWASGVTELNQDNKSAVEETQDFMSWAEKNGITVVVPGRELKALWNIYKKGKNDLNGQK